MFSIMYDKQTGEVLTICSGNFIIPEGCGLLKMDNIPDYNMDTQQLIVENDTLIVKDRQLTQEEQFCTTNLTITNLFDFFNGRRI